MLTLCSVTTFQIFNILFGSNKKHAPHDKAHEKDPWDYL